MSVKVAGGKAGSARMRAITESSSPSNRKVYPAILLIAGAVFLFLCLISYDPKDPSFNVATTRSDVSNLCGLIGSHIADALVQLVGLSAIAAPVVLLVIAVRLFSPMPAPVRWTEACSLILIFSGVSALLERSETGSFLNFEIQHPGGALGVFLHASFFRLLGSAGEILLSFTLLLISILHISRISVDDVSRVSSRAAGIAARILNAVVQWIRSRHAAREEYARRYALAKEKQPENPRRRQASREKPVPVQDKGPAVEEPGLVTGSTEPADSLWGDLKLTEIEPDTLPWDDDEDDIGSPDIHSWKRISFLPEEADDGDGEQSIARLDRLRELGDLDESCCGRFKVSDETRSVDSDPITDDCAVDEMEGSEEERLTPEQLEAAIEQYLQEEVSAGSHCGGQSARKRERSLKEEARHIRVTRRADEDVQAAGMIERGVTEGSDSFQLPPTDFLDTPDTSNRSVDEKLLEENAAILEQKLADLKISGKVVEIHPGPVITMYELVLAPGIPLRKVLSTSDDLAMALKCGSTRVVAPLPGKDTVGIEVPNLDREIVYFREIIESPAFMKFTAPLKIAMGKGIDGEPFASSLARMPHLLIAGATGTGKSVGLNCLICSLLMSCNPDDVKFLMVDPKKLELSYYQDIPHLLHPVVTEAEKVPKVLSWAIREMERRYDLLSAAGAKNIEGYNKKVLSGDIPSESDDVPREKLPYVVIIVDELAELMMVAAKDIEISIARLAQMARAAGIHLILATQRPSVDVITGVIKANFPARVSFQVSARPDSRTILDTTGAENLLGMGDMLFLPPGTSKMRRLHGAFVSENEISKIVDFIKAQRSPVYLQEIAKHVAEDESKLAVGDLIDDEKYDEAVDLVTRLGHASISLIQRHMRIGYNRAARIIEAMESEGIIGPSDGTSRPREVLARSLASVPDGPA
ncbi:MAG: DNA translocase FtsK 4TM domain-containing protein [Desulfomonilaceae bacterium]|nr:DNA translocase FtsK 4TM domain-containing protein [Desulfomonilaceae bacterium]